MRIGLCESNSKALKRYQRRVMVVTAVYVVLILCGSWLASHVRMGQVALYAIAVVVASPMIGLLVVIGMYLQEEKDEYLRWMTMRSLLVGTAALLCLVVMNDFMRLMANGPAAPPLVGFVLFFVAFGVAQGVQKAMNRRGADEEPAA